MPAPAPMSRNKSGYFGVYNIPLSSRGPKRHYRAIIRTEPTNRPIQLGVYANPQDCAKAWDCAAVILRGPIYDQLNFPTLQGKSTFANASKKLCNADTMLELIQASLQKHNNKKRRNNSKILLLKYSRENWQ